MKFITGCMILVVVGLASSWLGWNDAWYVIAGFLSTVVLLPVFLWWRRRKTTAHLSEMANRESGFTGQAEAALAEGELGSGEGASPQAPSYSNLRHSLLVGTTYGLLFGVVWVGYLALCFAGLRQVPWIYDGYYDRDRTAFETRLSTLESAKNFERAAVEIEARLNEKLSVGWAQGLAARWYTNLVNAGKQHAPPACRDFYAKAQAVAQRFDLDDTTAATLLSDVTGRENRKNRNKELHEQNRWAELISALQGQLAEQPGSTTVARELHQAYLSAAEGCTDRSQQRAWYVEASKLANQLGITPNMAAAAIAAADASEQDKAAGEEEHRRVVSELQKKSASDRQHVLTEWFGGTVELGNPHERLTELRRVERIAGEFKLELPGLKKQATDLSFLVTQQQELEDKIVDVRDQHDLDRLVPLLTQAIRTTDRDFWSKPLDQWLADALKEWCSPADVTQLDARRDRIKTAIEVTEQCRIDSQPFSERLAVIESTIAARDRDRAKIARLKELRKFHELVAFLRSRADEPKVEWHDPYDHLLYAALIDAAQAEVELTRRVDCYEEALIVAGRFEIDSSLVQQRLAKCHAEIEENARRIREQMTAVTLPPGTAAGIARLSADPYPAGLIVDICVTSADGKPITYLQAKDFQISFNGVNCEFRVASMEVAAVRRSVAILFDISASMTPALDEAKRGAVTFAQQIGGDNSQMKLIPFGSAVNTALPWTADSTVVATAAQALKVDGETALYRALFTAAEELGRQTGERSIVLITDGTNTVAGVTLDDVLLHCKSKMVNVFPIGLRTKDLDTATLQRLAAETRGHYVEARNAADLARSWIDASRSIRRHRYRFLIHIPEGTAAESSVRNVAVSIGFAKQLTVSSAVGLAAIPRP